MYGSYSSRLDKFILGSIDDIVYAMVQYDLKDHEIFLVNHTGEMSRMNGRLGSFGVSKNPHVSGVGYWLTVTDDKKIIIITNNNKPIASYDVARNRAYKRTE